MQTELTLPEAIKKIGEYEAKFTKLNSDFTELQTYVAEAKKADAESKKEAEAKKAEAKTKMAEAKKMLKAAYDEEDPDKVREKIAEASKHMGAEARQVEAESDENEKKDDEEKEAMKAELKKPRLQILTASYKGRVDDKTLEAFTAQWNKMSFKQLDAEIEKVKPFVGKTISQTTSTTTMPLGIGTTLPASFVASKNDEAFSAEMKNISVNKLFGGSD